MGLQLYNKKRKFSDTPEPSGKAGKSGSKLIFVIHRHKASHLHYDLRLEMDGVLKSWAVPKGPSLNASDKRLAMMVEDHPYSYRDFKGIIPEGNYGAGIVEVWDSGFLSDIDQSDTHTAQKKLKAGLKAGNLKFTLHGKKLKGEFALVKLKGKQENAWLLIKHKDKFATTEAYNSEDKTPKNSPINKWLAGNKKSDTAEKKKSLPSRPKKGKQLPGKSRKLENFIQPMLAKESETVFDDKEWIYEIKWDGYRAIADVKGSEVSMYSRNGNTFNDSYPIVVDALRKMKINAVLDGEIVVLNENGDPSFQLLQHYDSDADHPIQYCVFDVISINGTDVCDLTLIERKALLKKMIKKNEVVKYSDHIKEFGTDFFEVAKDRNLEGIMAKKADSSYHPGTRTKEWLKIKNHQSQEAIITGFTEPTGSRKYFGALVLGIRQGKELKYVGHTGSGFDQATLKSMYELMKPLIQKTSPFKENVKTNMPVTWVKPLLVCEIKHTEFTRGGHMRHPIFLRLREDKKASQVTMDSVEKVKTAAKKSIAKKTDAKKVATQKMTAKKTVLKKKVKSSHDATTKIEETLSFGKVKVNITNTSKIFWPKQGITKGDVISYYQEMANYILPYLKGRPQSLYRTPNGFDKPGFFHKDAGEEAPTWIKSVPLFSESANKDINYIICDNKQTLAYLNNLGCIELNPWHSTINALDRPDYLIIDLDPSIKNTFEQVIETANVVKQILDKAGANCFCKTSGATGLHIYIPMQKKYTYDQVKDFAHLICVLTQEQLPKFTSLERNLKKRGNNKIYLDHLQNRKGQTIACVYSLRPKAGATVSTPLLWKEVKSGLTPQDYTIETIFKRIKKTGDIFAGVLDKGIDLAKCLQRLEE